MIRKLCQFRRPAFLRALVRVTHGVANSEPGRQGAQAPNKRLFLKLLAIIKHSRDSFLCRYITLLGCFLDFLDRLVERFARSSDLTLKISLAGCLSVDSLRVGLFCHK